MMGGWLNEPDSLVIVCVYDDDIPVAVSRCSSSPRLRPGSAPPASIPISGDRAWGWP